VEITNRKMQTQFREFPWVPLFSFLTHLAANIDTYFLEG